MSSWCDENYESARYDRYDYCPSNGCDGHGHGHGGGGDGDDDDGDDDHRDHAHVRYHRHFSCDPSLCPPESSRVEHHQSHPASHVPSYDRGNSPPRRQRANPQSHGPYPGQYRCQYRSAVRHCVGNPLAPIHERREGGDYLRVCTVVGLLDGHC